MRGLAYLSGGSAVATVATESRTVVPGDSFAPQTYKLHTDEIAGFRELFERENAGECVGSGGLAAATSQKAPKRAPTKRSLSRNGSGRRWTTRRRLLSVFPGIFGDFADAVDVLGRP
jgi:hypothetical protein